MALYDSGASVACTYAYTGKPLACFEWCKQVAQDHREFRYQLIVRVAHAVLFLYSNLLVCTCVKLNWCQSDAWSILPDLEVLPEGCAPTKLAKHGECPVQCDCSQLCPGLHRERCACETVNLFKVCHLVLTIMGVCSLPK